jgi:hypothetical protein
VALLALIAGTVSYLHMHLLVELHGQSGWVAALTPLSVDGVIVAASTTLLADSRSGGRGGFLPWGLLMVGSVASLTANVAVAEPTATGRVSAGWPSFALIAAYELLMRQVRRSAATCGKALLRRPKVSRQEGRDRVCNVRGAVLLSRARTVRCLAVTVARAGICGGRRGSGRWLTGPTTARCRAGARSLYSAADTSVGGAWSSAPVPRASSLATGSAANRACVWSGNDSRQPWADDRTLCGR